jgi:hypothetical protein
VHILITTPHLLQVHDAAKTYLLQVIVSESVHVVRTSVADVVGVVAKHTVPAGQWPELLGFLHQCSQSANAEHREVGLTLFASLSETIGEPAAMTMDAWWTGFGSGACGGTLAAVVMGPSHIILHTDGIV